MNQFVLLCKILEKCVLDKTTGCIEWYGGTTSANYGRVWNGYKKISTHRFMYETLVGPIKEELVIRHKCDNPRCCNSDHLEVGTKKQNGEDRSKRRLERLENSIKNAIYEANNVHFNGLKVWQDSNKSY